MVIHIFFQPQRGCVFIFTTSPNMYFVKMHSSMFVELQVLDIISNNIKLHLSKLLFNDFTYKDSHAWIILSIFESTGSKGDGE